MNYPDDLKYTKEHEWIRVEGNTVTIGVTEYAAEQLGDIVYVELPEAGSEYETNDTFGVLESVKAVSDCFAPLNGTVMEANDLLQDSPEIVNEDPYGEGWMIRMEIKDKSQLDKLMDHSKYEEFVKEETS